MQLQSRYLYDDCTKANKGKEINFNLRNIKWKLSISNTNYFSRWWVYYVSYSGCSFLYLYELLFNPIIYFHFLLIMIVRFSASTPLFVLAWNKWNFSFARNSTFNDEVHSMSYNAIIYSLYRIWYPNLICFHNNSICFQLQTVFNIFAAVANVFLYITRLYQCRTLLSD